MFWLWFIFGGYSLCCVESKKEYKIIGSHKPDVIFQAGHDVSLGFIFLYKLKYLIINILWISTLQTLTPTDPLSSRRAAGIFDCLVSLRLEIRKWNVYVSADPIFLFFSLYRRSSVSVQRARNWFISEHEAVLLWNKHRASTHLTGHISMEIIFLDILSPPLYIFI